MYEKMNYEKKIEKGFMGRYIDALSEQAKGNRYYYVPVCDLKLGALGPSEKKIWIREFEGNFEIPTGSLCWANGVSQTQIDESDFFILTEDGAYPIGMNTAEKTIKDRARKSCIADVSPLIFEVEMKLGFIHQKPGTRALIYVNHGICRAVLSGDKKDYSILPTVELVNALTESIETRFGCDYDFSGGTIVPECTMCQIEVNNSGLAYEYEQWLDKHGIAHGKLVPVLTFETSETGFASAKVTVAFRDESTGREISLGTPVNVRHRNGATVEKFAKELDSVYSFCTDIAEKLDEIEKISVKYPLQCFYNVALELSMPRSTIDKVAGPMITKTQCTGFDIYMLLFDVTYQLKAEGNVSIYKILQFEEKIMQLLTNKKALVKSCDKPVCKVKIH